MFGVGKTHQKGNRGCQGNDQKDKKWDAETALLRALSQRQVLWGENTSDDENAGSSMQPEQLPLTMP